MSHVLDNLLIFGRILRRAGIDVHAGRMIDLVEALRCVNLGSRDEVYYTCRALLVHRHEQIEVFDRVFVAFWRELIGNNPPAEPRAVSQAPAPAVQEVPISVDGDGTAPSERAAMLWSDSGGLAEKDFAELTADEIGAARRAMSALVWTPGLRRTRRWVLRRGPRIDLRRAIGESIRTGGELANLPTRGRLSRPRPLVLLCDISGSMERYSRMLLHFSHALSARHTRVEAFLFSTQLTRITKQLRAPRPDAAIAAIAHAVPHWSGGTRIGAALKEFHRRWGRRVLTGGPVVLLISDGWDCGDPEELRRQIARLQRRSHRLIWLNPLIGTVDYAPLTRGLQAALPFVDDFLPSRTLRDFGDLASHLNRLTARRSG